jgi:hypothetical protein
MTWLGKYFPSWIRIGILSLTGLILLGAAAIVSRTALAERPESIAAAAMEQRLAADDRYLSSDELEGRGLGTHGIELAANFIAERFRALGLKTDACNGTPFQKFTVTTGAELGPGNHLAMIGPTADNHRHASESELILGRDFTPLAVSDSGQFELPLAFAGYGITDKAIGYDDYGSVNVAGKAVIVLRHEPSRPKPADGTKSRHALMRRKIANAYEHGAAAVILVVDRGELRGRDVHEDSLLRISAAGVRLSHRGMPVLNCRREILDRAMEAACGLDLAAMEGEIDRERLPHSRVLTGWRIAGRTDVRRTQVQVQNVIGILPASDHGDEAMVVGAHYDHFGITEVEVNGKKERSIYSGADDNASGVSAMLEIARYLSLRPNSRSRQVVFVAFTAEESGLLGSQHYVNYPVVPLSRTVSMVNFDMVGRLRNDKLYIRGTFTAMGWADLVRGLDSHYGLTLDLWTDHFGCSDQLSFYARDIPVLAFFTGRHEDYHQPSDKFPKVNVPGMRRVTQLGEEVVAALASAPARPQLVSAVPPEQHEAYFGAFGDFTRPEPGYLLGPVAKGGPADRAGLRDGDLVIRFGDSRISNEDDFNEVLTHYIGGERIRIVVRRGTQLHTLDVVLGPPDPDTKSPVLPASPKPVRRPLKNVTTASKTL